MLGADAPEAVLAGSRIEAVVSAEVLTRLRGDLERVLVKDELVAYLVDIVRATRTHNTVLVGAGPWATQALLLASRALAALNGRDYVTPDDVKALAGPVLQHRLILRPEYEIEGLTIPEVIERVLQEVAVPR